MAIGNFGRDIVFSVSEEKILTFQNLKATTSGRWAETQRIGSLPHQQFLGPDASTVTLTLTLSAAHGIKPRATQEKLRTACRTGKPEYFVVGNRKVVDERLVITNLSEAWETVYNQGEVAKMKVDVTFKSYA